MGRIKFLHNIKEQLKSQNMKDLINWLGSDPANINQNHKPYPEYHRHGIAISAKEGPLKGTQTPPPPSTNRYVILDGKQYEVQWDSDIIVIWQDLFNIGSSVPSLKEFLSSKPAVSEEEEKKYWTSMNGDMALTKKISNAEGLRGDASTIANIQTFLKGIYTITQHLFTSNRCLC